MKALKILFHFLGSVYLAIILILVSAVMVIAGTIIESRTESHLLAAQWTYAHPFFGILLWLFFINILFAALRRWPFKWKHLPFLITHLGLLMIFGGTILKNKIGLQGHLTILEGSGSQQVILPHTLALHIEKKEQVSIPNRTAQFALNMYNKQTLYQSPEFPDLTFKVIGYCPHVRDQMETWIKGDHAYISGYPPLQVHKWTENDLPAFERLELGTGDSFWNVLAIHTDQVQKAIKETYLKELKVLIQSKANSKNILELSLENSLKKPISFDNGTLALSLYMPYSSTGCFEDPHLQIEWQSLDSEEKESSKIALQGNHSLYNLMETDSWLGISRFSVDLQRDHPTLVLIEDKDKDLHLCTFDCAGRLNATSFNSSNLNNLIVYDEGFGGYAVQAKLPFHDFPTNRKAKEVAYSKILAEQIGQATQNAVNLAAPLALFKNACEAAQVNFPQAFITFLNTWHESYLLLFPDGKMSPTLTKVFDQMNWNETEILDREACEWICLLFDRLDYPIQQGNQLIEFLEKNKWPFLSSLKQDQLILKRADLLNRLAQQIFSIAAQLPPQSCKTHLTANEKAKLLSAYFRAHEIDYRILTPSYDYSEEDYSQLAHKEKSTNWDGTIETPLTMRYLPEPAPTKIEDRHGCILIETKEGKETERMALPYQNSPTGLKWPIMNGRYIVRFQPELVEIPYRIRLRQGREIYYPQTQQPYSYESDILIAQGNDKPEAKTLSMNHVHETWDGYRFYLAGMSSATDQGIKRVQIVVNHDPAKYLLTYPGALIVFMGIILLFWLKPYRVK